jgi:4-amino-4-deoxy-L-arabinose transferase-like glycosyltransferase
MLRSGLVSLNRKLWLLALLALLLRAVFLLLEPPTPLVGDEKVWVNWAVKDLVTGKVRFSPLRAGIYFYPPLYHYFIGSFHELFGSLTAVKWAQVLVSSLLVLAVGRIGALVFGERAGLAAAAITAVYPDLIWFSGHFWSETLFLTLLWWAFDRLLVADALASARVAAVAGVVWGLAVLTRETTLYLTPLAAVWLASARGRDGGLRRASMFLLAAVLTIAPWTCRNWVVFHAFVPVGTAGGLALYQGNSGLSREEVYERYEAVPPEGAHRRVAQYRWARRMGLQAIADRQPLWIFEKLRDEMPRFWEADSLALIHVLDKRAYGDVPAAAAMAARLAIVFPYLVVLAWFVVGVAALRPDRRTLLLLGFLVLYNLLHVATHGFARYRLPIMPVVFLFAGYAFAAWREPGLRLLTPARRFVAAALALAFSLVLAPSLRAPFLDSQDPPASEAR